MKLNLISFIIILFLSAGKTVVSQPQKIVINPEATFQTIHNFGASDAWSCQFVGNWPDKERNRVADLLFSLDEKEDGSPKGIGLSCWRFNIGAGSADQTTESKIGDRWRQTNSFLQSDGTYNWNAQSGQRWFLQAAQKRGVESFLGFVNSPPVWLTKNGRANSDGGNSVNLPKENFAKFSEYLIEVTKNIALKDGVLFDYISPINEPQWDWKGGQEGTPWTNTEMANFCRILGDDISKAGLSTQISIAEAGFLTHIFERGNDSKRGFQIKEFFSPESENYIGNVSNIAHKISGHSYHTVKTDTVMNLIRSKLHDEFERVDPAVDFWMSEYCILGGNGIIKGGGRDLGMETALFVANIMHSDLTIANASAWQWWIAVSKYDFKDGLVYIDEDSHEIFESKLMWTLGNFSRFVRPGAKRIKVDTNQDGNLKTSAYKNESGDLVIVIINKGESSENVQFKFKGLSKKNAKRYETSSTNSLSLLGIIDISNSISIPKESVSTFVISNEEK
jgi:O-glycosyl hydrolase